MKGRAHFVTALFWAALAAWGVLHFAHFETAGFDDRIVSNATLHGVDVGARSWTYCAALLAFVSAALLVAGGLKRFERKLGDVAAKNLEHGSLVGLLLVVLAGVTSLQTDAVLLCAALELAYLVCALMPAQRHQHGARFLVLAAAAYGLLAVTPWRTEALAVAGLTVLGMLALTLVERSGGERLAAFALGLAAAAACVPLALVLREEIVLSANQRGMTGISRTLASAICALLMLALAWILARRRPFDAERVLARVTLPALILGFTFLASWIPTRDPQYDMLESGNGGLALQQFFEYGRWPFFETFDVHGLSDCLMGFLYSWCNGWSGLAWEHWDFVAFAFVALAVYAVLARSLGHAPLAFVLVVASPFVRAIFPAEVAMAAAFALVAAWSARREKRSAFVWAALAWIALALWRMDLGGAAAVGLAVTWAAAHAIERPRGFAWKRALTGVALVATVAAVTVYVVARLRHVDLGERLAEFSRIAESDQAFGRARIFEELDAAVAFRLFVAPVLTLVTAVMLVVRARAFGADASGRRFATYALVFLAAFSLVIFTRGLVRHTFVEHNASYVTAFQFAVITLAPVVMARPEHSRVLIAVALALHVLLPLAFDVAPDQAKTLAWRANTLTRASIRLRGWTKTAVGEGRFDRTPIASAFRANNIEPMRALSRAVLEPGETFVDLSASPMLYVFAGARSPHWVNHLIVLQGDFLQKRFLAELEHERAPLVVMRQESDFAVSAGMVADVAIDKIPIALWHARIFDELMSRSEPLTMAGRWQVWARSDWAPQREWGAAGEHINNVMAGSKLAQFELAAGETLALAVSGRSSEDANLSVHFSFDDGVVAESRARGIVWPGAARSAFVDVMTATRPTRIELSYVGGSGPSLQPHVEQVRALRIADPARAEAAVRAETPIDTVLGETALAWGRHDRTPRTTAIPLLESSAPSRSIAAGTFERFNFVPRARSERSLLCEFTLSNPGARPATAVVRYGIGEFVGGTYSFDLAADAQPAVYVFRPGMQANWHRRPNYWIEVGSLESALIVHSARLCTND